MSLAAEITHHDERRAQKRRENEKIRKLHNLGLSVGTGCSKRLE